MKMNSAALAALSLACLIGCPKEEAASVQEKAQAVQPAQPASQQAAQQPAQPVEAQPAEQPKEEVAAAPSADAGKTFYMQGCVTCHGPDGTGSMMRQMMPKIGDLTSAEMHGRLKDADIEALITNGRDKMPPFGGVFKPDQIKSIIMYVRTMKK